MKKLKEPTYKRFITGPLLRFDDRKGGFNRLQRETFHAGERKNPVEACYIWDPSRPKRKGYERLDYAKAWAGRAIVPLVRQNLYARDIAEINEPPMDISDKVAITKKVKEVARWFGADLVGVCEFNPVWVYSHWGEYTIACLGDIGKAGDPVEIPSWIKYGVVMATEMDYEEFKRSPAVEAASNLGYGEMAFMAPALAAYIRQLGYHAIACGNDYALSIPLAIDAGLGELGRNGLLITEEFGPRLRICKVFTDLPLEADSPIDIGVQSFCESCQRCAEECPSKAIMSGDRKDKAWDISNNINVLKWPVKVKNCLSWWLSNASECGNCIRVCPYNKPKGWLHSSVRKTVQTTHLFDRLFVKMDKALGYGKQVIK